MPAAANIYRIGNQWLMFERGPRRGLGADLFEDPEAWLDEQAEKVGDKVQEGAKKLANKGIDAALSETEKALFGEEPKTGGAVESSASMFPGEADAALKKLGAPTGIFRPEGLNDSQWAALWSVPQIMAAYKVVGEHMPTPLLEKVYANGGKPALELAVARAEWGVCRGKQVNSETGQYVDRPPKPKSWAIWVCPRSEWSEGVIPPSGQRKPPRETGTWASPWAVGQMAGLYTPGKIAPATYAQGLRAWVTKQMANIKTAIDAKEWVKAGRISERTKASLTGTLAQDPGWFPQDERASLLALLQELRDVIVAGATAAAGGTVVPSNKQTDDVIKDMVSSGTATLPQVQQASAGGFLGPITPVKVAVGAGLLWLIFRLMARA